MPLGSISPFRPTGTVNVTAGSTSVNVPLSGGGDSVVVTNITNAVAYIKFGSDNAITASIVDMPILPNSKLILSINRLITYAAAVIPSGTGSIMFSRGDGSIV